MCDFWARVKIRKNSIESLLSVSAEFIRSRDEGQGESLESTIKDFWKSLGVKDMKRLCNEEPDLCKKIEQITEEIRKREMVGSGESTE